MVALSKGRRLATPTRSSLTACLLLRRYRTRGRELGETAKGEEERAKRAVFNSWIANGGSPGEFEAAWPNLKREMLTKRTLDAESSAREAARWQSHSRI